MEFKNFFYFINEFETIIEILQYVLSMIIFSTKICPSLDEIHIIPSLKKKRHVFFQIENDDFIYSPIPANWDIIFKIKKSTVAHCPFEYDHKFYSLLKDIIDVLTIQKKFHNKFNILYKLFFKIMNEYNFQCLFCKQLEKEIQQLKIPALYIRDIYKSLKHTTITVEEMKENLSHHLEYSEYCNYQIRNPELKQTFFTILFFYYFKYKTQYKKALINNEPTDPIYQDFKNAIINNVIRIIPFISYKNISFEKWYKSLFLFELDLQETKKTNRRCKPFVVKILFLLYYLFDEKISIEFEKDSIIHQKDKILFKKTENLYEYHPILRGNCIRSLFI